VTPELAFLLLGTALCVALAAIAVRTFARERRERIEEPKYKMLEDDDDR
jgi:hypothetical protein